MESVCMEQQPIMPCGKKICAEVFDNKLHTFLGQLKLHVPLAEKFSESEKERAY